MEQLLILSLLPIAVLLFSIRTCERTITRAGMRVDNEEYISYIKTLSSALHLLLMMILIILVTVNLN